MNFNFNPHGLKISEEKICYIKGFFDAEGGIPHTNDRFYIQLVQKNRKKLEFLKRMLFDLGIESGKIHNPSKRVDPNYWRFFIASKSYRLFAQKINSFHPLKSDIFSRRMMI